MTLFQTLVDCILIPFRWAMQFYFFTVLCFKRDFISPTPRKTCTLNVFFHNYRRLFISHISFSCCNKAHYYNASHS